MFRGKLLAAVKEAGLTLPSRLSKQWVVDGKSVGNGDKALVYLGRYLVGPAKFIQSFRPTGNSDCSS